MTKLNEAGVKAAIEALERLDREHPATPVKTTKVSEGNYDITVTARDREQAVTTILEAYLAAAGKPT